MEIRGRIHSTDLRNQLLSHLKGFCAYRQIQDIMLSFNDDIWHVPHDAYLEDLLFACPRQHAKSADIC